MVQNQVMDKHSFIGIIGTAITYLLKFWEEHYAVFVGTATFIYILYRIYVMWDDRRKGKAVKNDL